MDEFSLIDSYFNKQDCDDPLVLLGIGDDAACVCIPPGDALVVSMDTLVCGVHFPEISDPFDIAWRAVMVNISDIAAMGAIPKWALLALTLPSSDNYWLSQFSDGLHKALKLYGITLIGGDTTKGPLTISLTMQGLAPQGHVIKRSGAACGDVIFVSGELGAAVLAYTNFFDELIRFPLFSEDVVSSPCNLDSDPTEVSTSVKMNVDEQRLLLEKFYHPVPRVDFGLTLRKYASAAIDISDGLSADLNHICKSSQVGATIDLQTIPVHPLLKQYAYNGGLHLALSGGDDYEICFTVPAARLSDFYLDIRARGLACHAIGVIESPLGLRQRLPDGRVLELEPAGYTHF